MNNIIPHILTASLYPAALSANARFYVSPGTAHGRQIRRCALCLFAQLLFKSHIDKSLMKKWCALLVFAVLVPVLSMAQTGTWSGSLNVRGVSLTLVFNFDEDGCTIDSPDQGAYGIPAVESVSPEGMVVVTVPSIGAKYEGVRILGMISGTFTQTGLSFPLVLKPGLPKLNRPQTPVGPFPYENEEVSFSNGDVVLNGTLTLPQGWNGDTPAVLLVTGSGLQNRDEEIYQHKPFAVIADAFARAGIATLRYDDRGYGDPSADLSNVTTEDFKNDALAGVKLLKERFTRVGVAGHSEGGTIAFMLAAEKQTDFVISLAGGVISLKETLVQQNRYSLRELGFAEDVVSAYVTAISAAFEALADGRAPAPDINASDLPAALKENYIAAIEQSSTPYMRYFLSIDVRPLLGGLDCPVLAFNGTLDTQVDCDANLNALREGLRPELLTATAVKNVNHLFQHCQTGSSAEYKQIEETIAPEVIEQMISWLTE